MSERRRARCPKCGRSVTALEIDGRAAPVLVSGPSILVALQVPGLAGYEVAEAERLHRCPAKTEASLSKADRERLGR